MRHFFFILAFTGLFLTGACKEEVAPPVDITADLAYFPLELDQPLFYEMDSIVLFNTTAGVVYDTSRLEVRETLVERFETPDGTINYRGERWDRPRAGGDWRFRQTFTVRRSNSAAFRTEDNLTFTKLTFPLRTGKRWDGNVAFDDRREFVVGGEFLDVFFGWDYQYLETAAPVTLTTGLTFNESVLVQQAETDNLIDRRVAYERYAPGVGLVERFLDARHTQCRVCCGNDTGACLDLSWDEKSEKGFIIRQTLVRQ